MRAVIFFTETGDDRMKKRRIPILLCAAVLTLCIASPCALAADRSASCYYPIEVEAYTAGDFDQPRIQKVYQLSLSDDPASIPTEDFVEYGMSPILANIYLSELDTFMEEYKARFDTEPFKRNASKEYLWPARAVKLLV